MTIKLTGNFDTAELCNTLAAHFGTQDGWYLSGSDREVEFIQQNPSLDISGVQAIFNAHGAIDWSVSAKETKAKALELTKGVTRYKALQLATDGKMVEALMLLKTIGE